MSTSARRIPVNLVTGFLGVGKTTAVRHLLAHHPSGQRWAVLVNEFGEVGVDGALLADQDVVVQEVAGGCLCCVAAPAFTTGLNRVIRHQRPERILIEPSGLGHPAQVLETLSGALYADVLEVRATVCLMDPRHLASPRHREHPNFVDQIHLADVLVANKLDLCAAEDSAAFEAFVTGLTPDKPKIGMVEYGMIDPAWLDIERSAQRRAAFPEAHAFLVGSQTHDHGPSPTESSAWQLIEGAGDGYRRAGWLLRQRQAWPAASLEALIAGLAVERKKGVFLTELGWRRCNQDVWTAAVEPDDGRSRLELIDAGPIPAQTLDRALRAMDRLQQA